MSLKAEDGRSQSPDRIYPLKPLYTTQELAHALRLRPGTIRNKLSRGEDLPRSIQVGRRRLFPEHEVEAWLRDHEARSAVTSPTKSVPTRDLERDGRQRRSARHSISGPQSRRRDIDVNEQGERARPTRQFGLFGE